MLRTSNNNENPIIKVYQSMLKIYYCSQFFARILSSRGDQVGFGPGNITVKKIQFYPRLIIPTIFTDFKNQFSVLHFDFYSVAFQPAPADSGLVESWFVHT